MMLGLTRRDIARRFDEIVAFAELQEFIDAPVKTYSSGMYMRLGFAVAINVDPDVLLVDEVLAVGDESFTHKCLDKFADFRRRGKTVLIVTHSLDVVARFCDEALWLDRGRVRDQGDPKRVIDAYLLDVAAVEERQLADAEVIAVAAVARPATSAEAPPPAPSDAPADARSDEPPDLSKAAEGRWGSREAEITHVELRRGDGASAHLFQSGDPFEIRMHVRAHAPLGNVVFGVGIFNAEGICCYGTNTLIEGLRPGEFAGEAAVEFHVPSLDLVAGTYKVDVAVHRENGTPFDYHRQLYAFRVTAPTKDTGIYRPPHRWTFSGGIRLRE
jgi:hypothetical protein